MPTELTIFFAVIAGLLSSTTLFSIWLRPLFKMRKDVDDVQKIVEDIKIHQQNDYKRALRNEQLQKAQIKALIALLNNQISGDNMEMMKIVRQELQDSLTELI